MSTNKPLDKLSEVVMLILEISDFSEKLVGGMFHVKLSRADRHKMLQGVPFV